MKVFGSVSCSYTSSGAFLGLAQLEFVNFSVGTVFGLASANFVNFGVGALFGLASATFANLRVGAERVKNFSNKKP